MIRKLIIFITLCVFFPLNGFPDCNEDCEDYYCFIGVIQ